MIPLSPQARRANGLRGVAVVDHDERGEQAPDRGDDEDRLCLDDVVRLLTRLFRLVWGAEVDRALRPVLAVQFLGSTTFSAGWSFVGIWAIEELGASSKQLGVAFLIAAVAGLVSGYLGGHTSDYVGRRPMILLGWALLGIVFLSYSFVGHHVMVGLGLMALA